MSDVPSSTPSESDEPSISDVPTTSANPTADDANYMTMTVSWYGVSTFTVTVDGVLLPADCMGDLLAGVSRAAGNGITTGTLTCRYIDATAPNIYDITLSQSVGMLPYTVDFKVDGVTVPELSGEMDPGPAANDIPLGLTIGTRFFRFTNDAMRNTVADKELEPARVDVFLGFELLADPVPADDFSLTTISTLPNDISGTPVVCGFENGGSNLSAERFVCPAYGDENQGAAEYRFFLSAKRPANAVDPLSPFHINLLSNGVEIPGGPFYTGTQDTAFFKTFLIRSDSSDGPVILYDDDPPFVLKITFEAPNPETDVVTTIAGATPGAANCDSSNDFRGTAGMTYNVIISCRDYAAGDYTFTVDTDTTPITGAVYELFYDGVLQTALSGTGDIPLAAGTQTFTFTAPATRGDPLTAPLVTPGPLV